METEIIKNLHKMLALLLTTVFQWEVSIYFSAITTDKYFQGKKNRPKCWQASYGAIAQEYLVFPIKLLAQLSLKKNIY